MSHSAVPHHRAARRASRVRVLAINLFVAMVTSAAPAALAAQDSAAVERRCIQLAAGADALLDTVLFAARRCPENGPLVLAMLWKAPPRSPHAVNRLAIISAQMPDARLALALREALADRRNALLPRSAALAVLATYDRACCAVRISVDSVEMGWVGTSHQQHARVAHPVERDTAHLPLLRRIAADVEEPPRLRQSAAALVIAGNHEAEEYWGVAYRGDSILAEAYAGLRSARVTTRMAAFERLLGRCCADGSGEVPGLLLRIAERFPSDSGRIAMWLRTALGREALLTELREWLSEEERQAIGTEAYSEHVANLIWGLSAFREPSAAWAFARFLDRGGLAMCGLAALGSRGVPEAIAALERPQHRDGARLVLLQLRDHADLLGLDADARAQVLSALGSVGAANAPPSPIGCRGW